MKITKEDLFAFTAEQLPIIENLIERIEALEAKKSKRFVPPTVEEVQADMLEKGCQSYHEEGAKFVDFYTSKKWMVGKTKMAVWRSAVNNWLRSQSNAQPVLLGQQTPQQANKAAVRANLRNINDTSW